MASGTETVRHPKSRVQPSPESGPAAGEFLGTFFNSSVGGKLVVGITGACLATFVIFHMIGNLKLFQGREAINAYAYFLTHSLGLLLWIARIGLLLIFVIHIKQAISLKLKSAAARPVAYIHGGTVQATVASRTMIWTGITVGLFVLFHLAQFTFGWVGGKEEIDRTTGTKVWRSYLELTDTNGHHDVYTMVVDAFRTPWVSVLYVLAQLALFVHLRHGIPSMFQTLGLKNARFRGAIDLFGLAVALTILVGNCAIVLAVWIGFVK